MTIPAEFTGGVLSSTFDFDGFFIGDSGLSNSFWGRGFVNASFFQPEHGGFGISEISSCLLTKTRPRPLDQQRGCC
jgi:hypothetical protein